MVQTQHATMCFNLAIYQFNSSPLTANSDSYSYGSEGDDSLLDSNCYIAISDYSSQAQDELSVRQGQMVCVVDDSDESKE